MNAAQLEVTTNVLREVFSERARQESKWGQQDHPNLPAGIKSPPCAFFGMPTADAARLLCDDAFKRGTGSYGHILVEEVCEAIEAAGSPAHLREELVQVAAVAVAWVEKIDRDAVKAGAA